MERICGWKKLVNVRIVQVDGSDVTFKNMLLRELSGALLYIIVIGVVVSIMMVILREDRRSIHDIKWSIGINREEKGYATINIRTKTNRSCTFRNRGESLYGMGPGYIGNS